MLSQSDQIIGKQKAGDVLSAVGQRLARLSRMMIREMFVRERRRTAAPIRPNSSLELIEALTALGNYLFAAQRQFENRREMLGEALRASLGQYERAAECLRGLRDLVLREGSNNDDRS